MIRWEAVIIAILGALLGIVIGIVFGWALQQALEDEGVTALEIPVGQLARLPGARGAGRACSRRSCRRGGRRSSTCSRPSRTSDGPSGPAGDAMRRLSCAAHADADPARRHHRRAPRGGAGRRRAAAGHDRGAGRRRAARPVVRADGRRGVEPIDVRTDDGLHVLRHSTAHVLAQAVCDLWPGTKLRDRPGDRRRLLLRPRAPRARVSADDLPQIEEPMRAIVAAEPAVRARGRLARRGAARAWRTSPSSGRSSRASESEAAGARSAAGDTASLYRNDGWEDLCLGPHVPSHRAARRVQADRLAGAYWRGDEKNPQLTRIYGTAWATQEDLDAYLQRLEEAERRDHRKLGVELDLFSFPEEIGSGLAVFHPRGGLDPHDHGGLLAPAPRGGRLRVRLLAAHHEARAVRDERPPASGSPTGMFPPMELDGGTEYYLKPMNCPFHILIYRSRTPELPRAAAAAVRVRHASTATRSPAWSTGSPACAA